MSEAKGGSRPELVRGIGVLDGTLITVGAVVGSGIFLVGGDIAKALPHGGLILAVWLVGGLISIAGALTYAELGAMFPGAGGIYLFLREAYGALPGFLYGWACFLVIMSGSLAAIAVGTAEYFGHFVPAFSQQNVLASATIGSYAWSLTGAQLAGVGLILLLTAVNHFGLRQGVGVQNALTAIKIAAIVVFVIVGFLVPAKSVVGVAAPLPTHVLAGFGAAMIAVLWTCDGWYGLTFSTAEMKNPARALPLGLILGTGLVMVAYLLLNVVYLRALPIGQMGGEPRVAEAAAGALFGETGSRALAIAVLLSSLGCLSTTILYSSRIYQPMAEDGVFFKSLAKIHPSYRVPTGSLWAQSLWAVVLTLSGKYDQLYTYVEFVVIAAYVATGAAVFVLRRQRPTQPRPYRTWGYPWVPLLFLAACVGLLGSTVVDRPVESGAGALLVAAGIPAYLYWRKRTA